MLYKGLEIAKPEVKAIAKTGVEALTQVAEAKIKSASKRTQQKLKKVAKRRKLDALGS